MAENNENLFKWCIKCGTRKLITEFHVDNRRKRHINSNCKTCVREVQRRAYQRNRDHSLLQKKEVYMNKKINTLANEILQKRNHQITHEEAVEMAKYELRQTGKYNF